MHYDRSGQRLRYPAPLLAHWLLDGVLEFARISAHVRTSINPKMPHLVRIVLPARLVLGSGYVDVPRPPPTREYSIQIQPELHPPIRDYSRVLAFVSSVLCSLISSVNLPL